MRRVVGVLLCAFVLAQGPPGDACCMVPRHYPGDVDQSMQDVIVLHHDGREELVLRVRPFFAEGHPPPASLAWLVTVPTPPLQYAVTDPGIFEEARGLANHLLELMEAQEPKPLHAPVLSKWGVDGMLATEDAQLEIQQTVTVGPYAITPVKARGAAAVADLNRYLATEGFGEEDPEHLVWFAENDFTFLCIRITPPEGAATLGRHLELDPLHISFETAKPYYPGKYSANQGDFALALTLLTDTPVARSSLEDVSERLRSYSVHGAENLFTTRTLPGALAPLAEGATPERWYLNRFDSRGFNRMLSSGTPEISGWKDDVTWTLGGAGDLPPDWYYGDGERPFWHATDTRNVLQVLVTLATVAVPIVLLGVTLWLIVRFLRRRVAPRAPDA